VRDELATEEGTGIVDGWVMRTWLMGNAGEVRQPVVNNSAKARQCIAMWKIQKIVGLTRESMAGHG
jgi:hypothetical protein